MNRLKDILLILTSLVLLACAVLCVLLFKTNKVVQTKMETLQSEYDEMQSDLGAFETVQTQLDEANKKIEAYEKQVNEYQLSLELLEEEVAGYRSQSEAGGLTVNETNYTGSSAEIESVILEMPPQMVPAGTVLEGYTHPFEVPDMDLYFFAVEIAEGDDIYNRIIGKSYRENSNVFLSDLRYLHVLHYNFDHKIQVGEIIVNQDIAQDVLAIFKDLLYAEYEIQSMYLVDNYWTGDPSSTDTASIEMNNTSAFNYREVTGGGNLSNHAYGRAIDINPQQNPYVWYDGNGANWSHSNADPYIDRTCGDPHVIVAGDVCYETFVARGFGWGGNWSNPVDYQHFDKR